MSSTTVGGASIDALRLRDAMVDRLKEHGRLLRDARIEAAFRAVPRHLFLPTLDLQKVYSGDAIPTRSNEKKQPTSSSSEVAIMAVMAEQLELVEGQRVLEIGAGTGYNAAILACLVGEGGGVTTIDIDPEIAAEARAHLDAAGFERVRVEAGDGWDGFAANAPYDRIELTASTSDISPAWLAQLAEGGILLAPLWMRAGWQTLVAFRKRDGSLRSASVRGGGFMPLRGFGAPVDPGVHRDEWRVAGAHEEDVDRIVALLRTEPDVVLGPTYDQTKVWERATVLAATVSDVIDISRAERPGIALGLYDAAARGLAVTTFSHLSYLGPRIEYLIYGARAALPALRTLVEEGPTSCDEIEVEAERLSSPILEGGTQRRYFRPIVRRRTG